MTDRRTDRQTEFSSLDRVCISCSAVKIDQIFRPLILIPQMSTSVKIWPRFFTTVTFEAMVSMSKPYNAQSLALYKSCTCTYLHALEAPMIRKYVAIWCTRIWEITATKLTPKNGPRKCVQSSGTHPQGVGLCLNLDALGAHHNMIWNVFTFLILATFDVFNVFYIFFQPFKKIKTLHKLRINISLINSNENTSKPTAVNTSDFVLLTLGSLM